MDDPANWASWGGNYQGTRYSELDQINVDNVHQLQVSWMAATGVVGSHKGGPLVIGDTIYIHTPYPNKVIAFNQADQTIKWVYEPNQNEKEILALTEEKDNSTVNSGLAYGEGMIFLNQTDTTLVALNAQTGKEIWRRQNGDPKTGATGNSAPLIVNDKVIVGISGNNYGIRGYLTAYYIKDGSLAWRGYSMGLDSDILIDPEKTQTWTNGKMQPVGEHSSLNSWQDEQWKIGGGSTSGWITFDPKLKLIYYGTGAPSPWNPEQRPGDNRWTSALWARDADTGIVKWVYQMTPHDEWGYSGENESILIEQIINGKQQNILMHFDANGFAYQLDRETGELLSADKIDESVNWATKVDLETGRPQTKKHNGNYNRIFSICPTVYGGSTKQASTYSFQTNSFYISGNYLCKDSKLWQVTGDKKNVGLLPDFINPLSSWNSKTNSTQWQINDTYTLLSDILTTEGGILFYGSLDGTLKVADSETGEELYHFKTPSGIVGAINTWHFKNKQYVGVLSAWDGPPKGEFSDCQPHVHDIYSSFSGEYLKKYRKELCHQNQEGMIIIFSLPN